MNRKRPPTLQPLPPGDHFTEEEALRAVRELREEQRQKRRAKRPAADRGATLGGEGP
jgi:hypothetical protein